MPEQRIYRLVHPEARRRASEDCMKADDGWIVRVSPPTRNLEQNALLWKLLDELSAKVPWHGIKLSAEEYKDLLSAGLVKSRVVPNIDGSGFVILGQRTSKMTKGEFSQLLELVMAFGAEHGVEFKE